MINDEISNEMVDIYANCRSKLDRNFAPSVYGISLFRLI